VIELQLNIILIFQNFWICFSSTFMKSRQDIFNDPPFLDVAANWKAVALWKDPAYLKEKVGAKRADEKFPVFVAPDNLRFLAKGVDIEPMTLNELIDSVFSDNSEGKKRLYLRGPPLNEVMSDLDPEPAFVLDKNEHFSERMSGVWIGTAGNITPIHFDMWHGILTQIVGDKKVAMFHPDESNLLYPHSSLTANPHTSQVDLREWDQDPAVRSKYPKMQHATKYTAVLRPGDSLYIPPCWWHDVESLDNCISYTTRWEIGTRESIHPAAIK
jgi:lysine-specific demethylase 8